MRYLKIVVGALLIIVAVIFVMQNDDLQRRARLTFSPYSIIESLSQGQTKTETAGGEQAPAESPQPGGLSVPVYILFFMAFFAGLIVAAVYGLAEKYRLKRLVKQANTRLRDLEEELRQLRTMPLSRAAESLPEPEAKPEQLTAAPLAGEGEVEDKV